MRLHRSSSTTPSSDPRTGHRHGHHGRSLSRHAHARSASAAHQSLRLFACSLLTNFARISSMAAGPALVLFACVFRVSQFLGKLRHTVALDLPLARAPRADIAAHGKPSWLRLTQFPDLPAPQRSRQSNGNPRQAKMVANVE